MMGIFHSALLHGCWRILGKASMQGESCGGDVGRWDTVGGRAGQWSGPQWPITKMTTAPFRASIVDLNAQWLCPALQLYDDHHTCHFHCQPHPHSTWAWPGLFRHPRGPILMHPPLFGVGNMTALRASLSNFAVIMCMHPILIPAIPSPYPILQACHLHHNFTTPVFGVWEHCGDLFFTPRPRRCCQEGVKPTPPGFSLPFNGTSAPAVLKAAISM